MNPSWQPALEALGVSYLFPYQELTIAAILGPPGLRQGVVLPTGAGKSLCFQIPALLLPHPTLVIYPLRSLVADQKRRCDEAGLPAAVLQGGQTRRERDEVFRRLDAGDVKLLLTNPETLQQPRLLARLQQYTFDHAALDEAHCFTLWGKDFRPLYRELPAVLAQLKPARITAFTATASPRVTADWTENLFPGQDWTLIQAPADRTNLDFSREKYLSLRLSLPQLLRREAKPALIFCRNRDGVRQWAHHVHRETGLDVRFYHAGLSRPEKAAIEQWYQTSQDGVLVATNAYGMGVDKKNIRTVVHLDRPDKTEDYLQEGRDGQPAKAILLRRPQFPDLAHKDCWRAELLAVFGETPDACSGCDSCRGQTATLPRELVRCCEVLSRHVRRLDEAECRALLRGRVLSDAPGLERLAGWGLLAEWDDLTFSELWEGLKSGGWISFGKKPRPSNLLRSVYLF